MNLGLNLHTTNFSVTETKLLFWLLLELSNPNICLCLLYKQNQWPNFRSIWGNRWNTVVTVLKSTNWAGPDSWLSCTCHSDSFQVTVAFLFFLNHQWRRQVLALASIYFNSNVYAGLFSWWDKRPIPRCAKNLTIIHSTGQWYLSDENLDW